MPAPIADPTRPWKAVASAVASAVLVALTTYFTGANQISWNGVITTVISGAVTFLLTYLVPNPAAPAAGADAVDAPGFD